jgi:hypothetical protein
MLPGACATHDGQPGVEEELELADAAALVGVVDPGRGHAHEDLTGPGGRAGHRDLDKRGAELAQDKGLHGVSPHAGHARK